MAGEGLPGLAQQAEGAASLTSREISLLAPSAGSRSAAVKSARRGWCLDLVE